MCRQDRITRLTDYEGTLKLQIYRILFAKIIDFNAFLTIARFLSDKEGTRVHNGYIYHIHPFYARMYQQHYNICQSHVQFLAHVWNSD